MHIELSPLQADLHEDLIFLVVSHICDALLAGVLLLFLETKLAEVADVEERRGVLLALLDRVFSLGIPDRLICLQDILESSELLDTEVLSAFLSLQKEAFLALFALLEFAL